MLTCWHCGAQSSEHLASCASCGKPIKKQQTHSRVPGVEAARQTLTAPMIAVDPAFDPTMRPELTRILTKWKAPSSQSVIALHLMGQNYPLSDIQALRELLEGGWIFPNTPVFHRWKERWFAAEECPGLHSTEPIDPDDTRKLSASEDTEDHSTKSTETQATEAQMILAARLGNLAEQAASQQEYGRAIEIYEEVLQLHKQYPLAKKRLKQLRQKLQETQPKASTSAKPPVVTVPFDWDEEKTAMSNHALAQLPPLPSSGLPRTRPPSEHPEQEATGILTLEDAMGEELFSALHPKPAPSQSHVPTQDWNTAEEKTSMEAFLSKELPPTAEPDLDTISLRPASPQHAVVAEELELLSEEEFPTAQKPAPVASPAKTPAPAPSAIQNLAPAPSAMQKPTPSAPAVLNLAPASPTTSNSTPDPAGTSAKKSPDPQSKTPLFSTLVEATSPQNLRAQDVLQAATTSTSQTKEKTVLEKESEEEAPTAGVPVQVGLFQSPGTLPRTSKTPVLSVTPPPFQAFEVGPLDPAVLSSVVARSNAASATPTNTPSLSRSPSVHPHRPGVPMASSETPSSSSPTAASPPWQVKWGNDGLDVQQLIALYKEILPHYQHEPSWLQRLVQQSHKFCHIREGNTAVAAGRLLSDSIRLAVITDIALTPRYHQHDPLFRLLIESLLQGVEPLQVLCVLQPMYMPMAHRLGFAAFSNTMLYLGGTTRAGQV